MLSARGVTKMDVLVFWIVMPCSVVVRYHTFRGSTTTLHGVTIQKTST